MTPAEGVAKLDAALKEGNAAWLARYTGTEPPIEYKFPQLAQAMKEARELRDALAVLVKKGVKKMTPEYETPIAKGVEEKAARVYLEARRAREAPILDWQSPVPVLVAIGVALYLSKKL